jgi:hypothetical protein
VESARGKSFLRNIYGPCWFILFWEKEAFGSKEIVSNRLNKNQQDFGVFSMLLEVLAKL